jgi:hypothetical protein
MSRMILFEPMTPVALSTSTIPGGPGIGSGAQNLLSPEPKEVYTDNGGGSWRHIDIDFGSLRDVDCVFIGFTRGAAADAFFYVMGGTNSPEERELSGIRPLYSPSSSAAPKRRHAFVKFPALQNVRRVSVRVNSNTNNEMTIGVVAIGKALQTTYNREKGGGRSIIDTGSKESRQDGGFGTGHGTTKAGFRWTWGDLSDAEIEAIYDLGLRVGERKPIVVVEDPDATTGLNERLHYCTFDRFEAYERGDPGKHRWALSVTQWV